MASYTSVYAPAIPPDSNIWQAFVEAVTPTYWSKSVPPPKDPIIVTVSVPSGQVCFG